MSDPRKLVPVAGRIPPHDLDAEAAVLSAILLERSALDTTLPLLKPHQFYSEANRRIYEAAVFCAENAQPIDVVSVAGVLRDRERLAQVGGSAYLAQLVDAVPSVAHIETYARMVAEKWRVRQLISTCQHAAAEGYGDVGEVQSFIDRTAHSLFELSCAATARDLKRIGSSARAQYQRVADAASRGERLTGLSTGFYRLDGKLAGLHPGELTIVAARPGVGKTSFVLNISAKVVARDVTPRQAVLFFSLEMPEEQLSMRLLCSQARVDLNRFRQGYLNDRDWTNLAEATSEIAEWPLLVDDTPGISLVELRGKVRKAISELAREGVKVVLVVIDYLQLMTGVGDSREQEISSVSRGLKGLAKELHLPIVALSQLNRAIEIRGKDKRPQLSDLRESGAIEQDSDNVIFIYRDDYYDQNSDRKGIAELIVAKQRNGPTGKTLCRFEASCTRFDNLADNEHPDDEEDEAA